MDAATLICQPHAVVRLLLRPQAFEVLDFSIFEPWFHKLWIILWYRLNRFSVDAAILMYQPNAAIGLLCQPQAFESPNFSLSQALAQVDLH